MYAFICINGHTSYSSCERPNGTCPACEEYAYRIVSGEDARAQGCHSHDCTRPAQHPNGATLELHARTGCAYTYRSLSAAESTWRSRNRRSDRHLTVVQ
jgi:hypothetical protein